MTGRLDLRQLETVPDPCDPVCDFCRHYAFNGDENGAYTDEGRCEHPDHPRRQDPGDWCNDFACRVCGKTTDDYPAFPLAPGQAQRLIEIAENGGVE